MKKLSSKMKILLVLSICVAMMVPAMALASAQERPLVSAVKYETGKATLELTLTGQTTSIGIDVVNGDGFGENVVSSVKIALLEGKDGDVSEIVISPNQFNQKSFSNVKGTISRDAINGQKKIYLDLKVGGPKGSSITLTVTEYYKDVWPPNTRDWPPRQ